MTSYKAIKLAALVLLGASAASPALAAGAPGAPLIEHDWSWEGPFGTFERAQLQRGYKVYREVCASCHGLSLLSFRNLSQPGGPEFSEAQVKQIASEYQIVDGPDDSGAMFERPGVPSDRFKYPFANEEEARAANGGAYPVDFSVLAKARPNGPDYISSLLQGYKEAPEGYDVPAGRYYNKYFPGHLISMAPPLSDGQVEYTDGTPQTVEQYSEDIAAFLMWAAEPKLEERKKMGFRVMLFLVIFASLLYLSYRKIWADIKH